MFYKIAEKALMLEREGKSIVRLNVGDTNLPIPRCAVEAAAKSMESGRSSYGPSAGLSSLREAIARREGCKVGNVVVGPGSKHLIFALLSVLGKGGRQVAIPTPSWPAYFLMCKQIGLKAKALQTSLEAGWQFSEIPRSADIVLLCNPLNPTSTIYGEKLMKETVNEAGKRGAHAIIDEAYRGIAFERLLKHKGAIRVRSFSKEFNMESWRLGYAVAPMEVAGRVAQFNQITSTCVPEFVQAAGVACLENEKAILAQNTRAWKARLALAQKCLEEEGFSFAAPQSGMYVFASHPRMADGGKFALSLLKRGIAVAPGECFGNYRKFIRICANQGESVLGRAIASMGAALRAG